ncbi:S8 family peptidase [Labilibaculum antarcticum]|nr:S8 family peptidase [Labilibaculum antarcticum]
MRNKLMLLMAMAALFAITNCQNDNTADLILNDVDNLELTEAQNGEPIEGQYIVVLNESSVKSANQGSYDEKIAEVKAFANSMFQTKSGSEFEVGFAFASVIKGFSVKTTPDFVEALKSDSRVKYLEQDKIIALKKPGSVPTSEPVSEVIPWGITRVGYGSGVGKTAWIIDSGIDLNHPDLNVDVARSRDFTGSRVGAEDQNGHGTHCAGTVGAIDNEIGVVGVAAGANLVAVRVLDRRGSGSTSGVIAGVDYVASAASPGDAANMSLGGGISIALDDAVYAASQNGIYFALAAGNESDDANNHSPARVNGTYIWTISAMDINDNFAYFSNYGNPPVDFCEPGVSIYSTWKGDAYNTISGTSMAAPHMCGILLMTNGNPVTDGFVNADPDGNADPIGGI